MLTGCAKQHAVLAPEKPLQRRQPKPAHKTPQTHAGHIRMRPSSLTNPYSNPQHALSWPQTGQPDSAQKQHPMPSDAPGCTERPPPIPSSCKTYAVPNNEPTNTVLLSKCLQSAQSSTRSSRQKSLCNAANVTRKQNSTNPHYPHTQAP